MSTRAQLVAKCVALAHNHKGDFLGLARTSGVTKIHLECSAKHDWWTRPERLQSGAWCRRCHHRTLSFTIERAKREAQLRGGECLSKSYLNSTIPLQWQCKWGHKWQAPFSYIAAGSWCRNCSSLKSERTARAFLEKIFRTKFLKRRPPWLVWKSGQRLELDGYSSELGIAFEFQGQQHSKQHAFFYKSKKQFEHRLALDRRKKALCRSNDVTLLEIHPYKTIQELRSQLRDLIRRNKIKAARDPMTVRFSPTTYASPEMTDRLVAAAKKAGVCLITKRCASTSQRVFLGCRAGHRWGSNLARLENGHGCQACAGLSKKSISEVKKWAGRRGWKCLSANYKNSRTPMRWQCTQGHVWNAKWSNVSKPSRPTGCPVCAGKERHTTKDARIFAKSRGWKCLSSSYKDRSTKLIWQCSSRHLWTSSWGNAHQSKGCPYCVGHWSPDKMLQRLLQSGDGLRPQLIALTKRLSGRPSPATRHRC